MPFSRLAERRIQAAIEEGVFDDLPNRGKHLDLDEYFRQPADLRMAYSILGNANVVPEEVELLKDVARLDAERERESDPEVRARLLKALEQTRLRLSLLIEQRRRTSSSGS